MSTDELLLASDLVATGHVLRVEAGRDPATSAIYTYVTVDLTEVVRGSADDRIVVLKQLGGSIGRDAMVVSGQARFMVGEDVLVFAETRPRDRSLYTASLWQGKWTIERDSTNARVAIHAKPMQSDRGAFREQPERRDLASLLQSLRSASRAMPLRTARAANIDPDRATDQRRVTSAFALFEIAARWNEFDEGTPIGIDVQAGGQPGVSGGGVAQIANGAALWAAAAPFAFIRGDTGSRCADQAEMSGRISIAFMDPCGEISDHSTTVAVGGYWSTCMGGRTLNGVSFCRITGGFIINNNSHSTLEFFATPSCFQAVETHELGHTLGLAHTIDSNAIMYPTISDGCRTAPQSLGADDIAAIRFLYPGTLVPAPGPPSGLAATAAGATVTLTWNAPSTGGTPQAYAIEAGSSPGLSNLASFNTGTTATRFSTGPVAANTYYVRVKATNVAGSGAPSADVTLVVGAPGNGCTGVPGAPGGLTTMSNAGGTIMLFWAAASGLPASYLIEAGSSPGSSNLAVSDLESNGTSLTATGVARGTYYVRVRARNACGTGAPSNELTVLVP